MSMDVARVKSEIHEPKETFLTPVWNDKLWSNKTLFIGVSIVLAFIIVATFGKWILPYSPYATNTSIAHQSPSLAHWFGTDNLGRDILSRVMVGTKEALGSGVLIVGIA